VPVDRHASSAAELADLFAALGPTEQACTRLLEAARADAAQTRDRADEQARQLVAEARDRQATARAAVVAEIRGRRATESTAAALGWERRAAEIRRGAGERLPGFVDDVVDAVRGLVGDGAP
jgi:hypothetical protein